MLRIIGGLGILALVLAGGCAATTEADWPDVQCMSPSGIMAAHRLSQIKTWASANGHPEAAAAATTCESGHPAPVGTSDVHAGRVYAAWCAAQAAVQPGIDPEHANALWALCVSELTHGSDGGKASARSG